LMPGNARGMIFAGVRMVVMASDLPIQSCSKFTSLACWGI
jgi:hypothetical protein